MGLFGNVLTPEGWCPGRVEWHYRRRCADGT